LPEPLDSVVASVRGRPLILRSWVLVAWGLAPFFPAASARCIPLITSQGRHDRCRRSLHRVWARRLLPPPCLQGSYRTPPDMLRKLGALFVRCLKRTQRAVPVTSGLGISLRWPACSFRRSAHPSGNFLRCA